MTSLESNLLLNLKAWFTFNGTTHPSKFECQTGLNSRDRFEKLPTRCSTANIAKNRSQRAVTLEWFFAQHHIIASWPCKWTSVTTPLSIALGLLIMQISYQENNYFPVVAGYPGGGGGGTHNIFGWGCAARSWKPSPYFRPKYMIFHTLFHTWISKCIPYSRPSDVWQIRQLWIDFRRTGLWRPKRCSCFFLRVNVHGSTRCSKNGILYQIDGIYTLFQTNMAKSIPYLRLEMLENDTLWAAYTYMAYMCEYNPLPPPLPPGGLLRYSSAHQK